MDEEFTKAQLAYGHEGYCVRAVKSEHDQINLLRLQHGETGGACFAIGNPLRKQQLRHLLKLASEDKIKRCIDEVFKK